MWQTHSNYGAGIDPDQKKFWPVWKKVADLGIFAYLHPTVSHQPKFNEYGYAMAAPGLGFTIDTMGSIVRMILSGIFDEIPDLKVVLGHFGEALPFLMERMENRFSWLPNPKQKNKEQMGAYWGKNIFVTTSGNTSIPAFECTRAAIGIDSIMLGTDYPFEHMEECVGYLETCPMTEEEKEKLYYKNAEKLGLYL
jgi:predicted TIM-barrel fold metal-dependent hydrolase